MNKNSIKDVPSYPRYLLPRLTISQQIMNNERIVILMKDLECLSYYSLTLKAAVRPVLCLMVSALSILVRRSLLLRHVHQRHYLLASASIHSATPMSRPQNVCVTCAFKIKTKKLCSSADIDND